MYMKGDLQIKKKKKNHWTAITSISDSLALTLASAWHSLCTHLFTPIGRFYQTCKAIYHWTVLNRYGGDNLIFEVSTGHIVVVMVVGERGTSFFVLKNNNNNSPPPLPPPPPPPTPNNKTFRFSTVTYTIFNLPASVALLDAPSDWRPGGRGFNHNRLATFFRGDWSWNIFYGHSLPSADSWSAVVSFWPKNVHNTG